MKTECGKYVLLVSQRSPEGWGFRLTANPNDKPVARESWLSSQLAAEGAGVLALRRDLEAEGWPVPDDLESTLVWQSLEEFGVGAEIPGAGVMVESKEGVRTGL